MERLAVVTSSVNETCVFHAKTHGKRKTKKNEALEDNLKLFGRYIALLDHSCPVGAKDM
jgi:hypothetical protein